MQLFNQFFRKNFLICLLLSVSFHLLALNIQDTVYFDEDWSICEKPVAAYYRTTALNRINNIFYKGATKDFFITGELKMVGQYDENGLKQGEFEFYNKNGKVIKEGTYVNDIMEGEWSFFDDSENLKAKFYCRSGTDFTPLLIIAASGNVLVKDGTGKFSFDTQKDLPAIFPPSCLYKVEGEVLMGLKVGTFTYTSTFGNQEFKRTEIYQDGVFKKGKDYSVATGSLNVNKPFTFLDLADRSLQKIDNFYHSNIVFGFGKEGDKKLINFLLDKETPEIISTSNSCEENSKDIFIILEEVFQKYLKLQNAQHISFSYPPAPKQCNLLSFSLPAQSKSLPQKVHCRAVFTVDTMGYVVYSAFEGNLPKAQIEKINYYLSRLSALVPYKQKDQKSLSNIKINIETYSDTIKNGNDAGTIHFYYTAANASLEDNAHYDFNNSDNLSNSVQIEAKFPGGPAVWQKYLEKNLNSNILVWNNAPACAYRVVVSFLVDASGHVSEVQALNDPGYGSAEEAVRVIKKGPAWVPAVLNGRNVTYRQKQSISFIVSGR